MRILRLLPFIYLLSLSTKSFGQGEFWGIVKGNQDALFATDANGKNLRIVHTFENINPGRINNGNAVKLIEVGTDTVYGMTNQGGTYNRGVIFRYALKSNSYTALHHFNDTAGGNPTGSLTLASNGKLYGVTNSGGTNAKGVIFEFNISSNTYSVLWNFAQSTGWSPVNVTLLEASPGKLYGTTVSGGTNNNGVIFSYNYSSSAYAKVSDFSTANGTGPRGALWQFKKDTLYGCTAAGGTNFLGTIYEFDLINSKLTKLADFSSTIGSSPTGEFCYRGNNTFVGVCQALATNSRGSIWEFNYKTKSLQKTYDFTTTFGGDNPLGGMVAVGSGKLLGLYQNGYCYLYDPVTKKIQVRSYGSFTGTPTIMASSGKIISACAYSGSIPSSIAEIDTVQNKTTLIVQMNIMEAKSLQSEVVIVDSNTIFGSSFAGGLNDKGVIFRYLKNSQKFDVVWQNSDSIQIQYPNGNMVLSKNNKKLYGFCQSSIGVFELDPYSLEKHAFNAGNATNNAGLFEARDSAIYLLQETGQITQLDLQQRKLTNVINLAASMGNNLYLGPLIQGNKDTFYGVCYNGGTYGLGFIFFVDLKTKTAANIYEFNGLPGKNPRTDLQITEEGVLYGGLQTGGSFTYDTKTKNVVLNSTFAPSVDFLRAKNNQLYMGEVAGVYEYNYKTKTQILRSSFTLPYNLGTSNRLAEICFTPPCGSVSGTASVCTDSSAFEFSVPAMDTAIRFTWLLPKGAFFIDKDTTGNKVKLGFSGKTDTSDIIVTPFLQCPGKSSKFRITPPKSNISWANIVLGQNLPVGDNYALEIKNVNSLCHKSLEYSTDNGKTFKEIKTGLQKADSSVTWIIPDEESANCFLRIKGQNTGRYWVSPKFSIVSPMPYKAIDFTGEYNTVIPNAGNPTNSAEPGYALRFKLQIKNDKIVNLLTLKGELETADTNVIITDKSAAFNNILAGKKGWSADEFEIFIRPNCPDNHILTFDLKITDETATDDPWTSRQKIRFPVNVMGLSSVGIDDDNTPDSKGDNDDLAEKDEIIEILPLLKNKSTYQYSSLLGWLTATDQPVVIWDNVNGASGKVYRSWKYNAPGGVQSPMMPLASNIAPEQDYVFDYKASSTYAIDFRLLVDCYLTDFSVENPTGSGQKSPKIRYGIPFGINAGFSKPMKVTITSPLDVQHFATGTQIQVDATVTSTNNLDTVQLLINNVLTKTDNKSAFTYSWNTTGLTAGSYTLKVSAVDAQKNRASHIITVVLDSGAVSTRVIEEKESLRLFPNPTTGIFTLESVKSACNGTVFIYNTTGKLVSKITLKDRATTFDMQDLSPGCYYFNLVLEDGRFRQAKLIISKP